MNKTMIQYICGINNKGYIDETLNNIRPILTKKIIKKIVKYEEDLCDDKIEDTEYQSSTCIFLKFKDIECIDKSKRDFYIGFPIINEYCVYNDDINEDIEGFGLVDAIDCITNDRFLFNIPNYI